MITEVFMIIETKEAYDRFALIYEQNRGLFDMSEIFHDFYCSLNQSCGHLLDLGCGAGEPVPRMFRDNGWQITGVDFSQKMLELAKIYLPEMNTILADMTELDLPSDTYDAITAIYSIFHTDKSEHPKLFQSMYQSLKSNGKALFTYAGIEYTGNEEFSGIIEFMGESLYYSHLSLSDLRKTLQMIGFTIEQLDHKSIGGETFLWITVRK